MGEMMSAASTRSSARADRHFFDRVDRRDEVADDALRLRHRQRVGVVIGQAADDLAKGRLGGVVEWLIFGLSLVYRSTADIRHLDFLARRRPGPRY